MFSLTKTFTKEQFKVTPIIMNGDPIFLPQELGEQLGYANLADSIRNSDRAKEGIDYIVIDGEKLRQFKKLLSDETNRRSVAPSVKISPNASSLIVLTESGLWWTTFNSTKPECVALRIWVTSEVLPAIRKTGTYTVGSADEMVRIQRLFSAAKRLALESGTRERQARASANAVVKQMHGVDVYEILGITPPKEINLDEFIINYCKNRNLSSICVRDICRANSGIWAEDVRNAFERLVLAGKATLADRDVITIVETTNQSIEGKTNDN